jgi:hypothetical protein
VLYKGLEVQIRISGDRIDQLPDMLPANNAAPHEEEKLVRR